MENVKELLTNALNPQARLMAETRGLVHKWEKTGLLEGLKNDIEKSNMAHINCGYISQNIYLYCASEGLATIVRGWIDKDEIAKKLQLPSYQKVIVAQSVGYDK